MSVFGNTQQFAQALNTSAPRTTVNGGISGTIEWIMPCQGSGYKKVMIQLIDLMGNASFTFPVAFEAEPVILTPGSTTGAPVTAVTVLSETGATITGAGSSDNGILIIEGY